MIKQLERLEGAAGAAAAAPAGADAVGVGVAWSDTDERVDVAQMRVGEYVAADVHILGEACAGVPQWLIRERFTTDSCDLGWVVDAGGDVVGRVVAMDGSLLTLRYEAAPGAGASAALPGSARVGEP